LRTPVLTGGHPMAYIMLVDDDEDFLAVTAFVLRKAGHEVECSLTIPDAAARMEQRRPDLVILDIMFPESSCAGFMLARTIKHHNKKLKRIPVLVLSAVNSTLSYGVSRYDIDDNWFPVADFIEKPVDVDVLTNMVGVALEAAGPVQA